MKSSSGKISSDHLPITRDIKLAFVLSLVVALIMTAVSLGGLIFPSAVYPTEELLETYVANDVINLVIGLPILLGSMWLTRRGKLIGLLCWPGAVLYVLYNYLAYLFGMPLSWLTAGYFALVLLSAYSIFELLRSIDRKIVQRQLSGAVPVRIGGWFLVVFGVLFILRMIGMIVSASINQADLPSYEVGTLIADGVISALWITFGSMLLQRKPLGYVSGLGLLFVASVLFIGLILFLFLQPILTNGALALTDVIVVSIMGTICFIPTWLFALGVLSNRNPV